VDIKKIHRIFFIGIGGIGMSALARYFLIGGYDVAGYDRTSTPLTDELSEEGCLIHFEDDLTLVPDEFKDPELRQTTLVVATPAIPEDHSELAYFREKSFIVMKRSELLGFITKSSKGIAIAGTHGKTTVSTMIAYILKQSDLDCTAFLGGISKNFNSNLITGNGDLVVMEADEYDRSFLQLYPWIGVITSVDADHLDIYRNYQNLEEAFLAFANQVSEGGTILIKKGLNIIHKMPEKVRTYTYSLETEADFYATNIRRRENYFLFDAVTPEKRIEDIHFVFPGLMNLENAMAAIGVTSILGVPGETIKKALLNFSGVKRRFDIQLCTEDLVYIDDYAHHPEEIKKCIHSVREMFPGKKITGIFQPHLYTRTRDFANEFARSLEMLDRLILLEIYPARENPIEGINANLILEKINLKNKLLCSKPELIRIVEKNDFEVLVTMGAGDIDKLVIPIRKILMKQMEKN
jgi:UDP-N-acetylmuramate--alanine ligase